MTQCRSGPLDQAQTPHQSQQHRPCRAGPSGQAHASFRDHGTLRDHGRLVARSPTPTSVITSHGHMTGTKWRRRRPGVGRASCLGQNSPMADSGVPKLCDGTAGLRRPGRRSRLHPARPAQPAPPARPAQPGSAGQASTAGCTRPGQHGRTVSGGLLRVPGPAFAGSGRSCSRPDMRCCRRRVPSGRCLTGCRARSP